MIKDQTSAPISLHGSDWAVAMSTDCEAAHHSILITALSMHAPTKNAMGNWPRLWRSWVAASQRGCSVQVILPAPCSAHAATLRNPLAGRALADVGITINYVSGPRLLHAKTCIIDTSIAWVGSGNFTAAAAHHNFEEYIRAESPQIAAELTSRWESIK